MFGKFVSKFTGKKTDATPVTDAVPEDWNRPDKKPALTEAPVGPPSVRFDNLGVGIDVKAGTSILDASIAAGIDLNHYCGGMASCGSCMVTVVSGKVSDKDDMEEATLDVVMEDPRDRLGCQTRILGPVVVIVPSQD